MRERAQTWAYEKGSRKRVERAQERESLRESAQEKELKRENLREKERQIGGAMPCRGLLYYNLFQCQ